MDICRWKRLKVLVVAASYPYPGSMVSGSFNEKSVLALAEHCNAVEVLVPRPYAPPILSSLSPRWRGYARIVGQEVRSGVPVYRPAYLQIPRVGGAFWTDPWAFFWCRRTAIEMHRRVGFDGIISFDLVGAGGMAWRLGHELGIAATGWGTGGDMRVPAASSHGRVLIRSLRNLDVIFYQSHELLEKAASLLGLTPDHLPPDRHVVLYRGIKAPPSLPRTEVRRRIRGEWGVNDDQVVVLSIGRITRQKGLFELLEAISLTVARGCKVICVMIGAQPSLDETAIVQRKLDETPTLKEHARIMPACSPDRVWEYLCAADIFAFPSHREGMPNALLEAMAMGVPSIAFGIPPVLEIEAGTGGVVVVPPLDAASFAEAIWRLAAFPDDRTRIGERGSIRVADRFMVQKNVAEAVRRLAQVVAAKRTSASKSTARLSHQ